MNQDGCSPKPEEGHQHRRGEADGEAVGSKAPRRRHRCRCLPQDLAEGRALPLTPSSRGPAATVAPRIGRHRATTSTPPTVGLPPPPLHAIRRHRASPPAPAGRAPPPPPDHRYTQRRVREEKLRKIDLISSVCGPRREKKYLLRLGSILKVSVFF